MSRNVLKECGVCQDEYNEDDRCPKLLPCGHTFCIQCILELIIRNEKKCPNCRKPFNGTRKTDFMVNTAAIDLLQYIMSTEKKDTSSSAKGRVSSRSKMLKELKSESEEINNENIESCKKTEKEIQESLQRNKNMKCTVMKSHKMVEEEITSKLQTLKEECQKRINFLDIENAVLEAKLKVVREKIRHLEDVKNKLDTANTLNAVDEVALEVEEKGTVIHTWIEEFNSFTSRGDKVLIEFQKNVKAMEEKFNTIREILDSVDMEVKLPSLMDALTVEDNQGKLTLFSLSRELKTMDPSMKELFRSGRIFSVHELGNKRIYGKISLDGDNFMVHCLRDQLLPSNSYTIKHNDVMSLVNPSSKRAFLEFGTDNSTLGTILIDLTPQSKRAQNLYVLCNGQMGPSYLNTIIYKVFYKGNAGECVVGGDYESNNGDGGKEVVARAGKEEAGAFQQPRLAGSVCRWGSGAAHASQFKIVTKDNHSVTLPVVFGKVVSGLNVITDAIARFPNIRDVKVTNCGIVLPL